MRKCPEDKLLVGLFLFSKHLAVFPNLCQKKSWLKWNQEKGALSEIIVEEGTESLILKPQVRRFLLWLFHFLELKDFVSESQQQSGIFPCSNFRSKSLEPHRWWFSIFANLTRNTVVPLARHQLPQFPVPPIVNLARFGHQEKVREMVEAHSQSRQATSSALQRAGASVSERTSNTTKLMFCFCWKNGENI